MAELVREHPLLVLPRRTVRHEGQHRVLHSFHWPFDGRRVRVRIAIPLVAVVLDRAATHAIRLLPFVGCRPIQRLDENPGIAARVPAEVRPGGEGKVAYAVGREAPGERTLCRRSRGIGVAGFVTCHDRDRRVRPAGSRQARTLRRREHLLRVPQLPRCGHEVCRRYRERDVKAPVLEIELARADVRLVVPAADIVEHREPRVPLGHLIKRPVMTHASGAHRRHAEMPREIDVDRRTRRQRRR